MNILFILKGNLEILPPIIPRILYFAKQNIKVSLICSGISQPNRILFEEKGVSVYETAHKNLLLGHNSRIMDWSGFRRGCKKILRSKANKTDLLYICSADTALCLNGVFQKYKYVMQSNELYDRFPIYKNTLKRYAINAEAFVVPEYSRANICAYWYGLKQMPFVIPNIPYIVSDGQNQAVTDECAARIVDRLADKKIVLYQGHIMSGDRSLSSVAEALKLINDLDYVLVLMGANYNGSAEEIKKIYPNTEYIPFVKPPRHLEITSHAHIAVLSYDRVSLNNLFCAPNKIYEYSCFGVPMIGNDIPGLKYMVELNGMGVCAEYENAASVAEAIKKIDADYQYYSSNSKQFFKKSDLDALLDELLTYIKRRE